MKPFKKILQKLFTREKGNDYKAKDVLSFCRIRIYRSPLLTNAKLLDLKFNYDNSNWEGAEMITSIDYPSTETDTTKIIMFHN